MARNKYPEETVKLILDSAEKLFIEKGYEKTSLQDIINATNLSKGAIYHHFSSKEEIFLRIGDRTGQRNAVILAKVRDNPALNGREKLKEIFRVSLLETNQINMINMVPYLLDNPRFLAMQIRDIYEEVAPGYIQPILEEGIADGSIQAEHPRELAEAILVLSNIWMHPLLQPTSPEAMKARCEVFIQLMKGIGIDVLDEELASVYVGFSQFLEKIHK